MDIPFIVQLAKIVGVVLALIIICSIVSLFFKRYRKIGVWILSIIFAGSITTIGYFYCPRHFEKNYLSSQSEINPLFFRQYADSLDFYIGSIGTCEEISDPRFYDNFNSITPENALKIGSLLVNDQIGKYDFSHADSIINLALEKKLRIRGHTLVWGKASWLYKSPDLNSYLDNFPENERGKILWDITKTHITTVLNH
jgi:endo-1,4-beta-xylanase